MALVGWVSKEWSGEAAERMKPTGVPSRWSWGDWIVLGSGLLGMPEGCDRRRLLHVLGKTAGFIRALRALLRNPPYVPQLVKSGSIAPAGKRNQSRTSGGHHLSFATGIEASASLPRRFQLVSISSNVRPLVSGTIDATKIVLSRLQAE